MLLEEIGKGVGEAGHKKRKSQAGCSVRGSFSLRPIPPETADIHYISGFAPAGGKRTLVSHWLLDIVLGCG